MPYARERIGAGTGVRECGSAGVRERGSAGAMIEMSQF